MYPWHKSLSSWGRGTGLSIDALGLVTLLGSEEMDRSIGRLMPSMYFDHLPLLGAFVIAGDRFAERKTGYTLYNVSAGIMTTEMAGWFSRWLQAQHFHKVRSKVTWKVVDRPGRWKTFFVSFLVSFPLHAMLIALAVLAADWWGLANVVTMIISVVVRCAQVAENQAGIDENIRMAKEEVEEKKAKYEKAKADFEKLRQQGRTNNKMKTPVQPRDDDDVKAIVVTADSNVITINAPGYLIRPAFTANPHIPTASSTSPVGSLVGSHLPFMSSASAWLACTHKSAPWC